MLETQNISNFILQNISFKLDEGEIISLLGHNGSGKTTLLKTIIGLHQVEKGKIIFLNEEIHNLEIHQRAQKGISYIMQEIPEYIGITVENYVKGILKDKFDEKSLKDKFRNFGLDREFYKNRNFDGQLSGGEKKKIEIITTFLLDKKIYLLDEIETSLDVNSRNYLKNWIKELNKKGKSFIIVSHNQDLLELADKGILMCNGKIQHKGKIEEILPKYLKDCENCEFTDNCKHEKN